MTERRGWVKDEDGLLIPPQEVTDAALEISGIEPPEKILLDEGQELVFIPLPTVAKRASQRARNFLLKK